MIEIIGGATLGVLIGAAIMFLIISIWPRSPGLGCGGALRVRGLGGDSDEFRPRQQDHYDD